MPYFAMVVVVEASDEAEAHDAVATGGSFALDFVGDPWECLPVDGGFETVDPREWRPITKGGGPSGR